MTETYQDIIDELTRKDYDTGASYVLAKDGVLTYEDVSYFTEAALDICKRVRDAVASDPSEWWVADVDGNRVHIGDKVMYYGEIRKIALLGTNGNVMDEETSFVQMSNAHKVIPDTREKIIEDAMAKFAYDIIPVGTQEVIEQAVDRAMKLEVDS